MKRGYLGLTFLFVVALLAGICSQAEAQIVDCNISSIACSSGYVTVGRVSTDGHFDQSAAGNYLCCRNVSIGGGVTAFKYSTDGHVSVNSSVTAFSNDMGFGFSDQCVLRQNCIAANDEFCVFKVTNTTTYTADNSHIYDCDDTTAGKAKLCCAYTEMCNNGIDDDFDGYIDCADTDCHATPVVCTGSPYNSSTCVSLTRDTTSGTYTITNNSLCVGTDSLMYYCSYPHDSTATGVCCPSGKVADYNIVTGWRCVDSAPCGIQADDYCVYDFDDSRSNWLSEKYAGNADEWCVSRMPNLYNPEGPVLERSTGCCLIVKDGQVDYYTDESNVKIYGTS